MFWNLKCYYDIIGREYSDTLPVTFHISKGLSDPEFHLFKENFDKIAKSNLKTQKNIWIIKPGENSNRGNGIFLSQSFPEIVSFIEQKQTEEKSTTIIQKYIEKPLLISKRKFDIRMYALVTSVNGIIKAYFY